MKTTILAASTLMISMSIGMSGAHAHYRYGHHHHVRLGHVRHGGSGGMASWYAATGHRTASGESFSGGGFTAAHRYWPFGTRVLVTNESNGRSVVVRINDRGPFVAGRIIDLSRAAANAIAMGGTTHVRLARL